MREGFPPNPREFLSTMRSSPPPAFVAEMMFFGFVPAVYGINFIVIKGALPAFASPLVFNALRWILAACMSLTVVALRRDSLRIAPQDWGSVALIAVIGNVLQQVTFINGIRLTTAGHSALIMGLSPIMVALGAAGLGLEPVTRRMWTGILLSIGGLALLVRPGAANLPPTAFWGDLLTLASAACWAVYILASRPLTVRYPPAAVAGLAVALATIILVLIAVPDVRLQSWGTLRWPVWSAVAYSGILTIALGYVIWSVAIRRIGASRTAILANLNPVVALIAAWMLLGERLDLAQALGALLVIVGVGMTRR
jgi:drug/metabolite transporter (DMT)-like permease